MGKDKNVVIKRVPLEFDRWVRELSIEFHYQTGLPKSNTATMRRMATRLKGRVRTKGTDFEIV